jgi:hypothetical protein
MKWTNLATWAGIAAIWAALGYVLNAVGPFIP